MRSLRNELTEAHQTNAELTARIGRANPSDGSRALGLWALERHRQARLASTPLLGLAVGPGADLTVGLTEAIRVELELLREEVGTHAELATLDLGESVDAHEALTILRIVQELTSTLAKRADELQVHVGREERDATVRVVADRLDRPAAERVGVRIRARRRSTAPSTCGRTRTPTTRCSRSSGSAPRTTPDRRAPARPASRRTTMATKADRTRIEKLIAPFRVDDPKRFRLADRDPGATDGVKRQGRGPGRASPRASSGSSSSRPGSPRRRPTAWSSCSRRSTPRARTARSST